MRLIKKIPGIFDKLLSSTSTIAAALIGGAWVVVCVAISFRLLSRTISVGWFIEIVEYCLLWTTFVGAAWLLRNEGHVRIDIVLSRLKPKSQVIINTFTSIVGSILCLTITWFSIEKILQVFASGSIRASLLEPPTYVILLIIPIGMFLLFIQFGRKTYQCLKLWIAK